MTYKLQDLTTGYHVHGQVHVVAHNITAQLEEGLLTCLLGPNGAGKSTMLRTLAAFQPALAGQMMLGNRLLTSYEPKELARHIGVVLTERPDLGNMHSEELVAMGRSPYTGFWGKLRHEDEQAVDEAINLVGIQALRHRLVTTLSDGERQKVMIAKALAQQTPIILLDEPTAFLDFPSKVELMLLLRRLAHEMGKTILISTHDVELALQTADRLWLMNKEQLKIGSPGDLARDGALSHFFSGPGISFDVNSLRFNITY